jgi:hypothetical protein
VTAIETPSVLRECASGAAGRSGARGVETICSVIPWKVPSSELTRSGSYLAAFLSDLLALEQRGKRLRRIDERGGVDGQPALDQPSCGREVTLDVDAHCIDEAAVADLEH